MGDWEHCGGLVQYWTQRPKPIGNGALMEACGVHLEPKTESGEIGKPGLVSPTLFGWVWRSIAWPCSQPGDGETGGAGKNCGLYVKLKKSQRINRYLAIIL